MDKNNKNIMEQDENSALLAERDNPKEEQSTTTPLPAKNASLFGVYLIIGSWIHFQVSSGSVADASATIFIATLWLGFVLAISGMEAWMKFSAPFCPRHLALDIGRTIFPALNSVEIGLCVSLWMLTLFDSFSFYYLLSLLTLILLLDVSFLTPKLQRRGKQVLYQTLKNIPSLTSSMKTTGTPNLFIKGGFESAAWKELSKEFSELEENRQDKWHVVYIVLEVVKIICLSLIIKDSM